MEDKLEYVKMNERLDWAIKTLVEKANGFEGLKPTNETIFRQACEMARTLFVRSEIAYSGKK